MPLSAHKLTALLSCTVLGLVCGTLYAYSSFGPQLALQLEYLATEASLVILSGNFGNALSGPFAGTFVDKKGYVFSLMVGIISLIAGYVGLRAQYVALHGLVLVLCLFLFLVGCGLTLMFLACLKCSAMMFPHNRGVAISLPSALYGLLAMFYSMVAALVYPGDACGFFLFLSLFLAVIFACCAPAIATCDLLAAAPPRVVLLANQIELEPADSSSRGISHHPAAEPALLLLPQFWLLFFITGALAAVGQMYIYSVGYMVRALVATRSQDNNAAVAALAIEVAIQQELHWQVAAFSATSCMGRLVAGFLGDFVRQKLRKPRSWLLFVPAVGLTAAQLLARDTAACDDLYTVSLLSGFMYGFTFCILPIIVGDVFGMENFSRNWGVMLLAPFLPANFFTSTFGMVYDSNSVITDMGVSVCSMGKECYGQVFALSLVVAIVALVAVFVFNFGGGHIASKTILGKPMKS